MRFYEVVPTAILKHRTVPRGSQHKPLPTFALVMAARLFFLAACLFCASSAFSIAVPSSQLAVSTRDVASRHGCKGAAEEARHGEEGAAQEARRGEEGAAEAGRQEGRAEARG